MFKVDTEDDANSQEVYELKDHLGNVRAIAAWSGNNLQRNQWTDYYPYGHKMASSSSGEGYRFGYQGDFAEEDKETGWNFFEARAYDPVIGRWMAVDPARQYASGYVGVGNNPVNGIDPDGRKRVHYNSDGTWSHTSHDTFWHNLWHGNEKWVSNGFGEFNPVSENFFWNSNQSINGNRYTGELSQHENSFWENQKEGNVFQKSFYTAADGMYLMIQSLNTFNKYDTHLDGEVVIGWDKTDAFVETTLNTVPIKIGTIAGFTKVPKKWVGERVVMGGSKLTLTTSTILTKMYRSMGINQTIKSAKTPFGPAKNLGTYYGRWYGTGAGTIWSTEIMYNYYE